MSNEPILGFQGEYRFLSNFWHAPFYVSDEIGDGWVPDSRIAGVHYWFFCSEQAYMVHKDLDPSYQAAIMRARRAGDCKALGRSANLRPDWEEIKDDVMLMCLRYKFAQNPVLALKLMDTGTRYLEETNTWRDRYWGVCDGSGRNMLGHLLMQVRSELSVPGSLLRYAHVVD